MDRQRLFNDAYLGLKNQGFVQSGGQGEYGFECRYRGDNGCKCAIGHCIPDDKYNIAIEGVSADLDPVFAVLEEIYGKSNDDYDDNDNIFLLRLQWCHDTISDPERMKENLIEFANNHNLTIPS